MSKESWAEWILSSYSESINPPHFDVPTPNPEQEPYSSDASASPWGQYTKSGRGGAGNFAWESDLPHDVEAQTHPSLGARRQTFANAEESERLDKLRLKKRPTDIHTGRGGAGNLAVTYATQPLRSPSWPISPPSSESSPTKARSTSAVYGRGGAGNLAAGAAAASQTNLLKIDEERKIAEDLREKAEHDVENMLRPPEGAFLAGNQRRESNVGL